MKKKVSYLKDFATKCSISINLIHYILDECAKLSFFWIIFQNSRKLISRSNRWMNF